MKKSVKKLLYSVSICIALYLLFNILFVKSIKIYKIYEVSHKVTVSYNIDMVTDYCTQQRYKQVKKYCKEKLNADISVLPDKVDFNKYCFVNNILLKFRQY